MNDKQAIARASEVMRRQHKAVSTHDNYLHWLKRYIGAIRHMPNPMPSEQKLERFLTELARRDVSAATQNQAFNAILFFYRDVLGVQLKNIDALRATRPVHQRNAPSPEDTHRLLTAVLDTGGYPNNLVAHLLYGSGLRVGEAVALRIKDVDLVQSKIVIREPKFGNDRTVRLPCSLIPRLEQQMTAARSVWERDRQLRVPIQLPHQLARKYPEFEFAWPWAWLFPLRHTCADPHQPKRQVRWHMLTDTLQRAVKRARREIGVMILPHELLMAVERKFDGESRHQTALRYIREAENRSVSEDANSAGKEPK